MKLHCFICATAVYLDDPEADRKFHAQFLHAQVAAFQKIGVPITLIQNGCEFPSLGFPVLRNPILKSLGYNYLLCDANCTGDYWVFLPEDCRITPEGWDAIRKRECRPCFSLSKDPKCLVCRKGIFDGLAPENRAACDLNFMGKAFGHLLLRGELDKQGFHCITPDWPQVSTDPPLWANRYLEMIAGEYPKNLDRLRGMTTLDNYGVGGYKASAARIEELYGKIVKSSLGKLEADALACKSLISKYGPILCEIPYEP